MSDARRYAVWPDPRSRSRSLKGSRPSVPHGTNFYFIFLPAGCRKKAATIRFTHRPKFGFFAAQGRLVAPIHVKLGRADGHCLPGCAKFHLNRHREVGMRLQKCQKIPLFGKESPRRGDFLDRFRKFLGAFIRLTIVH